MRQVVKANATVTSIEMDDHAIYRVKLQLGMRMGDQFGEVELLLNREQAQEYKIGHSMSLVLDVFDEFNHAGDRIDYASVAG